MENLGVEVQVKALHGEPWWQQLHEEEQQEVECVLATGGLHGLGASLQAARGGTELSAMTALEVPQQCRHALLASLPAAQAILWRAVSSPNPAAKARHWSDLWKMQMDLQLGAKPTLTSPAAMASAAAGPATVIPCEIRPLPAAWTWLLLSCGGGSLRLSLELAASALTGQLDAVELLPSSTAATMAVVVQQSREAFAAITELEKKGWSRAAYGDPPGSVWGSPYAELADAIANQCQPRDVSTNCQLPTVSLPTGTGPKRSQGTNANQGSQLESHRTPTNQSWSDAVSSFRAAVVLLRAEQTAKQFSETRLRGSCVRLYSLSLASWVQARVLCVGAGET